MNESARPLTLAALLALMSAMFVVAVGYGVVLPVLPFLLERLAGPRNAETHTGLLTGTYVLAIFLFAPLWGWMSDRHGRRSVLLLGLGGFALSLVVFALADRVPLLYLGRFLGGLFAAAIAPAAYALVSDHATTKEWRAHRFALLNIAQAAGFFIGPMVGGLALFVTRTLLTEGSSRGLPAALLATSAFALVAGLIVWRLVPIDRQVPGKRPTTSEVSNDRRTTMRLFAIAFLTALAVGAFEVGLALRGKQVLGLNAYQIGLMFAECSLVMLAVQTIVFSPLIRPQATRWLLTPSLVILAMSLAAVPFATTSLTMAIAVAFVAGSAGILSPIVTYWISLGAGQTQGIALGGQTAVASLGQAIGSAAGGLLFSVVLISNASFTLTAAVIAMGLTVSLGLPRRLEPLLTSDPANKAPERIEEV